MSNINANTLGLIHFITILALRSGQPRAETFDSFLSLFPNFKEAEEGEVLQVEFQNIDPNHPLLPHMKEIANNQPSVSLEVRFFSHRDP